MPFRPTAENCPYNFFRTTIDNAPNFLSAVSNLLDNEPYLNVSRPGCWSYPDMLEVGAPAWFPGEPSPPSNCTPYRMTLEESAGHFAAWCTVSSPLILSFDLSNLTEYDTYWSIISNQEAIAINQAWAGEPGRLAAMSSDSYVVTVYHGAACEVHSDRKMPYWTVWSKMLPNKCAAVVALNSGQDAAVDISVPVQNFGFPEGSILNAHDVWTKAVLPCTVNGVWTVSKLEPHDNRFVVLCSGSSQ